MKKIVLLSLAAFSIFSILSCNEKKAESAKTEVSVGTVKSEPVKQSGPMRKVVNSVMISDSWTLCTENEDGTMKSKRQTEIGDSVKIVYLDNNKVEKKADWKFANGTSTKDINWVLVEFDGEEYWTRDLFIADDSVGETVTAIIQADARIYTADDDMTMTKDILKGGSKVAYYEKSNSNLARICIYNGKPYGKSIYVEKKYVSSDSGIIEYFATFKKLDNMKDVKPEVQSEIQEVISQMEGKIYKL